MSKEPRNNNLGNYGCGSGMRCKAPVVPHGHSMQATGNAAARPETQSECSSYCFSVPKLLLFLALAWCGTALAHEVQHSVESAGAVVLHLNYADGRPFSFEAYELYAEGERIPAQVGRTDALGRVVFLPGAAKQWRARAFSPDGHGVDLRFAAPAMADPASVPSARADRFSLVLFGVSLLLGGFGLYQLLLRRKSP